MLHHLHDEIPYVVWYIKVIFQNIVKPTYFGINNILTHRLYEENKWIIVNNHLCQDAFADHVYWYYHIR